MQKIFKYIFFLFTLFIVNSHAMVQKGAGMSSEQARINSINNQQTINQYCTFTEQIKQQVQQALNSALKKTTNSKTQKKIASLKNQMSEIIQSMGVLKFVVSFAGLLKYARQYQNIWNNSQQLQKLLTTLSTKQLNIHALIHRFILVYDNSAFAGDLDMHSACAYLSLEQPGTYLIRISQKHSPGGFTFSVKTKKGINNYAHFFFTGNNNEMIRYEKKFNNLMDVIKHFDFEQKLKKPVEIYGISLGSVWKTKNKY